MRPLTRRLRTPILECPKKTTLETLALSAWGFYMDWREKKIRLHREKCRICQEYYDLFHYFYGIAVDASMLRQEKKMQKKKQKELPILSKPETPPQEYTPPSNGMKLLRALRVISDVLKAADARKNAKEISTNT